jgi:hypothetical protein
MTMEEKLDYHIYQVYIDPDTEQENTMLIASVKTAILANRLLKMLYENLNEIGDPNISFSCNKKI